MVSFHFKKKLVCKSMCQENFRDQVKKLVPEFIDSVNGHISIIHSQPHQIFVTFYTEGKHEHLTKEKKTVFTDFNDMQKKFSGQIPTKAQLENL